ncbi:MAG TPA: hypothetical protein VFA26_06965, partial [Gemmataceae bacterium]|nr:hypothetical protein [Gemmataceae bacterium]
KAAGQPPDLPRDFGAAHLDRSFEQNRLGLAPEQSGEIVRTTSPAALARVRNPLGRLRLSEAVLRKERDHDLLAQLTLRYSVPDPAPPLCAIALPLWAAFGPARVVGVEGAGDGGGHLALVWAGPKTYYVLRLPHAAGEPFELEAQDRHLPAELAARVEAAAAFDRAERQARRRAGKPLARLPRHLDVGWSAGAGRVELGMTRQQARAALPRGQSVLKLALPDGLNVLFTGEPPRGARHVVRQAFLRFDGSGRLAEVRVRHGDGPASKGVGKWAQDLLAGLQKQCGAAQELPAPWAKVWAGLPAQKPQPRCARWRDDLTELTFQRDAGGAEVVLRDEKDGPPPSPAALEYLPRGPEGCTLGEERGALLRRWGVMQPTTLADGAIVLPPRKGSPYEALLVWFDDGGRVARVVARHRWAADPPAKPDQAGKALLEAWGRDVRALGWPRRQAAEDDVLKELAGTTTAPASASSGRRPTAGRTCLPSGRGCDAGAWPVGGRRSMPSIGSLAHAPPSEL